MEEITNCPTCNAKIKPNAVIGQNELFSEEQCELIAEMSGNNMKRICQKCSDGSFKRALETFKDRYKNVVSEMQKVMGSIPIVTTHNPASWDYKVIGMATGQSTTGTGLFSEMSSSWTDLFGAQSNAYNKKIAEGERLCMEQIRSKAIQMGGNAVIAADIDYSEMGAGKGMIMVCMSGTVVKLRNIEELAGEAGVHMGVIDRCSTEILTWSRKYPDITRLVNAGTL